MFDDLLLETCRSLQKIRYHGIVHLFPKFRSKVNILLVVDFGYKL